MNAPKTPAARPVRFTDQQVRVLMRVARRLPLERRPGFLVRAARAAGEDVPLSSFWRHAVAAAREEAS